MADEEELTPFEQLEAEAAREQSEQQAQQQATRENETSRARLAEVSEQDPEVGKALQDNRIEQGQEPVEQTQADKQDVYAQAAAIGQDMQRSGEISHSEMTQTEQLGFLTPSETPGQEPQYATGANNEELAAASQHYAQGAATKSEQSPMDSLQAEAKEQTESQEQEQQQEQQEQEQ